MLSDPSTQGLEHSVLLFKRPAAILLIERCRLHKIHQIRCYGILDARFAPEADRSREVSF